MSEEKTVGHRIRMLGNLIHRAVRSSPVKAQADSCTGSNAWIIGYIGDHPEKNIYQRDLESRFGITRSTASKVVNLMVQKGLIIRESVEGDARLKKLVLTDKSWEIYHLMENDIRELEESITEGFTKEELDQFDSYMERMIKNLKKEDNRE